MYTKKLFWKTEEKENYSNEQIIGLHHIYYKLREII